MSPSRDVPFQMTPQDLSTLDMTHVLHPHATVGHPHPPVIFDRGQGALIWDIDGKEYVDGTGGLWLNAVGHGRPELAEAAARQMQRLEFYSSFNDFANEPSIRLAATLTQLAPPGLNTVFFTSGGSEGNETAIKLARLAHHAAGNTGRTSILSRRDAYHGSASGSMAASGIDRLKAGFGPITPGFIHLSAPRASTPAQTDALIEEVERTIEEAGAGAIGAFIGEPVQGVGGVVPPPEGYWSGVQEILRRYGILLIVDEVITGFGRTGFWFACEKYGIEPDVIVTAKALTSGYMPMGAVLIGDRLKRMLDGVDFRHGFTYNGHPVAAAVAQANLDVMEREGLVDRARTMGAWLLGELEKLRRHAAVVDIRGSGMMLGVELNQDPNPVVRAALEAGVVLRAYPPTIIICPPLVIEQGQAARIVQVLDREIGRLQQS